jgi:hypothetical protein
MKKKICVWVGEKVASLIRDQAEKIAAHRAEVRKELEAFKRKCIEETMRCSNNKSVMPTFGIESIDIDAFMEREESVDKRQST